LTSFFSSDKATVYKVGHARQKVAGIRVSGNSASMSIPDCAPGNSRNNLPGRVIFFISLGRASFSQYTSSTSLLRSSGQRASLGIENLALRHQIGVLQRSARKRPKMTSGRTTCVNLLSRLWRDWRYGVACSSQETVVAGIRAAFRLSLDLEGALRKTRNGPVIARESRI